jgi:TPP-dependent pyruvate/acetoin dehydrogenase alpha subunit
MMRGRAIEDVIASGSGHYHPARGEEGVIVGAFAALDEHDVGVPHYRGAVIASLTRGADMHELLAGILGKVTGPTRGRQRGDFLGKFTETSFGLFSGTLGPSIGYAVGSGLATKLDGSPNATVVTFGDGTANSGLLYESLNMAGMLNLPVVFVCQNNQYAVSMPSSRSIAGGSLSNRAAAFGIFSVAIDGNDVIAVETAVREALERARQGQGPSFIDAQTYRVSGHWVSDACAYRNAAETERWRTRDPIATLAQRLISDGRASRDEIDQMAASVSEEAQAAMAAAQADPWPDPSVIDYRHAYAD